MARHRSLRALLLALALLAAACAGTDDNVSTEAANSADDATAEGNDADNAAADESMADDEAMSDESSTADTSADGTDAMADDPADDSDTSAPVSGPPPSLPPEEAAAAAEQNIPNLQSSDDARDIEVVSVQDGSITSLRQVVTGDRPVLVWFWAPH